MTGLGKRDEPTASPVSVPSLSRSSQSNVVGSSRLDASPHPALLHVFSIADAGRGLFSHASGVVSLPARRGPTLQTATVPEVQQRLRLEVRLMTGDVPALRLANRGAI